MNPLVRLIVKRKNWGRDEYAVARRARRTLGSLKLARWWNSIGLEVSRVDEGEFSGERICPPKTEGSALIMYIHGGGFLSCSAATHRPISSALARFTGCEVYSVDYRLGPEHRFPAAVDDVHKAYQWLRRKFEDRPIALAGDSAGGGLVLSLMLRLRSQHETMPACAVCFSPWTDLTGSSESVRRNSGKCHMFYAETVDQFAKGYVSEDETMLDGLASPVFADVDGLPPVLFQVSSTEILLDDSKTIHEKIIANGGISELEVYDDVFHCWQMAIGFLPEAERSLKSASRFIKRYVSSPRGVSM